MKFAQKLLSQLSLPTADLYDLPTSALRFPDGAHYRIEIPSVEGPVAFQAVIEEAKSLGVPLHRISQGSGGMLLRSSEIQEMARLGYEYGIEVCLFVGPRAPWDGSAQPFTPDGKIFGWRQTGMDQLAYALDDVSRMIESGIRSLLIADEGLLWLIHQARQSGALPRELVLKASALMGIANPIGAKLLVEQGLNTINIASDVSLPRLASYRRVIDIPLDLYIESPDSLGGFTRYYELSEIIRLAAPVHLKFGLRNAPNIYPSGAHLEAVAIQTGRERVRRAAIGLELLGRSDTEFFTSKPGAAGLGIPVISD